MNFHNLPTRLYRYIADNDYRFISKARRGCYDKMDDATYLRRMFSARMKKPLNLNEPQTFNEKLQWLKLHDRKPEYCIMADKYRVRAYIAEKLGEEHLIPLLGVWDNPDEIDFDSLPNEFVLKCNHNSGLGMCICTDKSQLDIEKVRADLNRGLQQNYYLHGREWPYKHIPRKIIAEQYMVDASLNELRDYKFFCFNGVCRCMKIDYDRFSYHRANYYDREGNLMDLGESIYPPAPNRELKLPDNMHKMLELAEQLSADISFLRVDFYEVNGRIYFGELTFYPNSGFAPLTDECWDNTLGEWLQLPTCDK